ncbi:MAG: hypothetical protein WA740_00815 [Candidatus Binataceae bacterium]
MERKRRQIEKAAGHAACLQALEDRRRCAPAGDARPSRRHRVEEAVAAQD